MMRRIRRKKEEEIDLVRDVKGEEEETERREVQSKRRKKFGFYIRRSSVESRLRIGQKGHSITCSDNRHETHSRCRTDVPVTGVTGDQ